MCRLSLHVGPVCSWDPRCALPFGVKPALWETILEPWQHYCFWTLVDPRLAAKNSFPLHTWLFRWNCLSLLEFAKSISPALFPHLSSPARDCDSPSAGRKIYYHHHPFCASCQAERAQEDQHVVHVLQGIWVLLCSVVQGGAVWAHFQGRPGVTPCRRCRT